MNYFCGMKKLLYISFIIIFIVLSPVKVSGQTPQTPQMKLNTVNVVPACVYKGDTIPWVQLPTLYVFKPRYFKDIREKLEYLRLVHNVKVTLPIAKLIKSTIIETYEFVETLPNEKAKQKHIKLVEIGLKQQYTAQMKKLTFKQGKILIKLVDRECNQSSYQLIRAFMGPFKAAFYQTFASIFGASLSKEYKPYGEDADIEKIVLMIDSNQI
jgi:hypothetical protein